jgi:hypothetical protein
VRKRHRVKRNKGASKEIITMCSGCVDLPKPENIGKMEVTTWQKCYNASEREQLKVVNDF